MPRVQAEAPSKYRAQRTEYKGVLYDSKAEAARALELDLLLLAGELLEVVSQPRVFLGCRENKYVPDFLVIPLAGGVAFYEDVKGAETPKFKRDRELWRRFGRLDLRIIRGGQVVEIVTPQRGKSGEEDQMSS